MSSGLVIDPEKPPKRKHSYYSCVRCGRINDEYEAFSAGSLDHPRYYCCSNRCIPLRARIKLWWQGRRNR